MIRKREEFYHYRFMVSGQLYTGNCGTPYKKEAEEFELRLKKEVHEKDELLTILEKKQQAIAGDSVKLAEAWGMFSKLVAPASERREAQNMARWNTFVQWCRWYDVDKMSDVDQNLAAEYIGGIRQQSVSGATVNDHIIVIRRVFKVLQRKAGIAENPFDNISKVKLETVAREAFSPEQLKIIGQNASGWMYHLFMVGISTGLREGDICTLRWSEVQGQVIKRRLLKTGAIVEIPMIPALSAHIEKIRQLPMDGTGYVSPELAAMYMGPSRSNIGKKVSQFLQSLGIDTAATVNGRTKKAQVLDVHSLRHTFCYMAAIHGIPLPIVQSIVGHMSPDMTQRYMNHASIEAKTKMLSAMPEYLSQSSSLPVIYRHTCPHCGKII